MELTSYTEYSRSIVQDLPPEYYYIKLAQFMNSTDRSKLTSYYLHVTEFVNSVQNLYTKYIENQVVNENGNEIDYELLNEEIDIWKDSIENLINLMSNYVSSVNEDTPGLCLTYNNIILDLMTHRDTFDVLFSSHVKEKYTDILKGLKVYYDIIMLRPKQKEKPRLLGGIVKLIGY